MPPRLISLVLRYAKDMAHSMVNKGQVYVEWSPLREHWFKLNTNGSFRVGSNSASYGGVLRDSLGNWIVGIVVNLGCEVSVLVELWGSIF